MSEAIEGNPVLEQVPKISEKERAEGHNPMMDNWPREGNSMGWQVLGGHPEITEDSGLVSRGGTSDSMKAGGSYLPEPGLPSASGLFTPETGGSWQYEGSSLTMENVDKVNRLGGNSEHARLAWGGRQESAMKQMTTPRSSNLHPVLEKTNYGGGPVGRPHPSYHIQPFESPRSREEGRENHGGMSVKEYRESVYDLSQNPWGPDVSRAVVQHPSQVRRRNRERPASMGRMPSTVRKRYKDALTSTSDRVIRFGWRVVKNFWTWFAVIAVIAAREGFKEENKTTPNGVEEAHQNFGKHPGWVSTEPNKPTIHKEEKEEEEEEEKEGDGEAKDDDKQEDGARKGKEKLRADSFMG